MTILMNAPLHYPDAREWMWDYCIYLGPFQCDDGTNVDLGILFTGIEEIPSAAIVYGNEPGEYLSGSLDLFCRGNAPDYYKETKRRAIELGLIT